jgi:hypothetical protein
VIDRLPKLLLRAWPAEATGVEFMDEIGGGPGMT